MELLFSIAFVKIFILGLLINSLFFKRTGILSCGIFGGSFNRPIDELMLEKIKILGLFNMSRGKDSCGYFNGRDLEKGVDKNKEFFDFVVNEGIKLNDDGNNIFIGHTRQSSVGFQHTEENAHPFNINDKLILAHNGTIRNIWALCTKYGVPFADIHVDSKALGYLMLKRSYHILEEYEGAAALLIHRTKDPDSLYVYHGLSRESEYLEPKEERPLFWMQSDAGVYLSSLKNALEFIKTPDCAEPEEVPHNRLIKIKSGIIIEKPLAIIDRSEINKAKPRAALPSSTAHFPGCGYPVQQTRPSPQNARIGNQLEVVKDEGLNIMDETSPPDMDTTTNRLFFHRGRYRESLSNALCHGIYTINRKTGEILASCSDTGMKITQLYFWAGVYLESKKQYEYLVNMCAIKSSVNYQMLMSDTCNFAKQMSHHSKYPVTNLPDESKLCNEKERTLWYYGGKPVSSESTTPIYSMRDYHFKEGRLVKIVCNKQGDRAFANKSATSLEKMLSTVLDTGVNFSAEVTKVAKRFEEIFLKTTSVNFAQQQLGEYCMDALKFYMEDIMTLVLGVEYDDKLCETLVYELIDESIQTGIPLIELFDPQVSRIEMYLVDAMGGEDEDTIADKSAESKSIETIDYEDVIDNRTKLQKKIEAIHSLKGGSSILLNEDQKREIVARFADKRSAKIGVYPPVVSKEIVNSETSIVKEEDGYDYYRPGESEWEGCGVPASFSVSKKYVPEEIDDEDIKMDKFPVDDTLEEEVIMDNLPKILQAIEQIRELGDTINELKGNNLAKSISQDIDNQTDNLIKNLKDDFAAKGNTEGLNQIKSRFSDSLF